MRCVINSICGNFFYSHSQVDKRIVSAPPNQARTDEFWAVLRNTRIYKDTYLQMGFSCMNKYLRNPIIGCAMMMEYDRYLVRDIKKIQNQLVL